MHFLQIVVVGLLQSVLTMEISSWQLFLPIHCRLWLYKPMREWQSRSHRLHLWIVGTISVDVLCLRRVLLSKASARSFSSPAARYWLMVLFHLARLAAASSQDSVLMPRVFMSLLHTSLYLSLGCPVVLLPDVSSPHRMSLGMRPSSIRQTWPSQRSLRCCRSVYMLDRPERVRTILRMHLRWKGFSFFSFLA